MNTRCNQGILAILLLGSMGFGTTYAQSPTFSSFEYNQAPNTVHLEWLNSTNAFYEMQAITNLMTELWGQEGGWTNILGTNLTNQVSISVDGRPNGFFRLFPRSNSPQNTSQNGLLYRINTTTSLMDSFSSGGWFSPNYLSTWSHIFAWDEVNSNYIASTMTAKGGWNNNITLSNNQVFICVPAGEIDHLSGWPFAYLRDWRLTSPEDLPVTGDVLIEWSAFESYSTPCNPVPDIPVVEVTIMNSDWFIVTNFSLVTPVVSSVLWESDSNPDGYYWITVGIGGDAGGGGIVEEIVKQVYLYN